jgi:hypothetical protein
MSVGTWWQNPTYTLVNWPTFSPFSDVNMGLRWKWTTCSLCLFICFMRARLLFFHHTNLGKIPIFLSKNPPQHIELEQLLWLLLTYTIFLTSFFVYGLGLSISSSPTFLLNSFLDTSSWWPRRLFFPSKSDSIVPKPQEIISRLWTNAQF